MSTFFLDGDEIPFVPGQTIMQAARAAGRYIPHLCWHPDFEPYGGCKLCTVKANGRLVSACTTATQAGMAVENRTPELDDKRRTLLQMLFVEGNHFCPSCEKSGNCLLQATAYEMGMMSPHFDMFYPDRPVDASHPDMLLDFNRCILCALCVRASADVDGKNVFAISGRGIRSHLIVNAESGRLVDTDFSKDDRAASICPVGVILKKRVGFAVPIGSRQFDKTPVATIPPLPAVEMGGSAKKLRVATASLGGCFGCHMSFLDIDERLLALLELIEFDRSPITDIKTIGPCDLGLVEGGVCNADNVQVLREFRRHCKILVAVGACAVNGGLPAQRNHLDLRDILEEVYHTEAGISHGGIPNDPELPLLLNKVHPIHEVVKVDYFLPGCPPSADAIWKFLTDLLAGRTPHLGHGLLRYD